MIPIRDDVQKPGAVDTKQDGHLSGTRRDVLIIAAAGAAFLVGGYSEALAQEAEAGGEASPDSAGGDDRRLTVSEENRNPYKYEEAKNDTQQQNTKIEAILGSEYRAPTFGFQSLTTSQLVATRTPDRPPEAVEVAAGAFSSDGHNQRMMSSGQTPLDGFVESVGRSVAGKLPEGVTLSVGVNIDFQAPPGRWPIFVMKEVDYSRTREGESLTIGLGKNEGVYVSVSKEKTAGWLSGSLSVGGFAGSERLTLMSGVNVTDIVHGTLTVETGGVVSAKNVVVEVMAEARPIEIFHDAIVDVLSPLSDYRNFQDPMLY